MVKLSRALDEHFCPLFFMSDNIGLKLLEGLQVVSGIVHAPASTIESAHDALHEQFANSIAVQVSVRSNFDQSHNPTTVSLSCNSLQPSVDSRFVHGTTCKTRRCALGKHAIRTHDEKVLSGTLASPTAGYDVGI